MSLCVPIPKVVIIIITMFKQQQKSRYIKKWNTALKYGTSIFSFHAFIQYRYFWTLHAGSSKCKCLSEDLVLRFWSLVWTSGICILKCTGKLQDQRLKSLSWYMPRTVLGIISRNSFKPGKHKHLSQLKGINIMTGLSTECWGCTTEGHLTPPRESKEATQSVNTRKHSKINKHLPNNRVEELEWMSTRKPFQAVCAKGWR